MTSPSPSIPAQADPEAAGQSGGKRIYSAELKQHIIAACSQPGQSIAAVAHRHGIAAGTVRRWMSGHRRQALSGLPAAFIPVSLTPEAHPAQAQPCGSEPQAHNRAEIIHIEVKRPHTSVVVHWPVGAAAACAQWLQGALA